MTQPGAIPDIIQMILACPMRLQHDIELDRIKEEREMNIQEQEERDFHPMSPYEFNEAAVQQEGYLRPAAQYLLTDYDTLVLNPFWDGVTEWDFSEAYHVFGTDCVVQIMFVEPAPPLEDDGLPF